MSINFQTPTYNFNCFLRHFGHFSGHGRLGIHLIPVLTQEGLCLPYFCLTDERSVAHDILGLASRVSLGALRFAAAAAPVGGHLDQSMDGVCVRADVHGLVRLGVLLLLLALLFLQLQILDCVYRLIALA